MKRKSLMLLAVSHFLMLVTGAWIAWRSGASDGFFRPESTARSGRADRSHEFSHRLAGQWTGSEYARAWKALRGGIYTTKERIRVQRDLLVRWAEVDLAAAIEAALEEAWDRDGSSEFDPCGPLLDVFSEALAKNPHEGWDMIRGRQFGVGTGMLRRVWIEAVGKSDPIFLANHIAQLSSRDRALAIGLCHMASKSDGAGDTRAELFRILAALPAEMVSAELLVEFSTLPDGPLDLDAMRQNIIDSNDVRLFRVNAYLLGSALAGSSADEITDQTAGLSQEARMEVLWAAFVQRETTEDLLELLDLLVDGQAWEKLDRPDTAQRMEEIARSGSARKLAEWALTLPVGEQSLRLFQRGVEYFLRENLEASVVWLNDLPEGEWRDFAYGEFSRSALLVHKNPVASRWALDRINDANVKVQAETWCTQWKSSEGWTKK